MTSDDKAKRRRHFYIKRQQFIDEILFDHGNAAVPTLTAFERNVALMIAKSESPDTGETFESYSSIARRLGGKTKVRHVENAAEVLEAREWLRIEPRGGRVYLSIRVKGLHDRQSTKLQGNAYGARQQSIALALECEALTYAERMSYIGLLSISDKHGVWPDSQREAALWLGIPRRSFDLAIQNLDQMGLVSILDNTLIAHRLDATEADRLAMLELCHPGKVWAKPGQRVGKADSEIAAKSMGSAPTPVTPVTPVTPIPSPSDSAPSASRNGRADRPSAVKEGKVVFNSEEWERLHQLVGLIIDNSHGGEFKTGAGIIAVSGGPGYAAGGEVGDEVYSYPYDWAELQKFAKAGLLIRRGDRYYISTLGWQAYEWFEQQQQKEAA